MLPLLLAALGAPGAAPFVLQVASWCSLSPNGSAGVRVALSRMPLVPVRASGGVMVLPVPERLSGCDGGAVADAAAPFVLQVASWCSLSPNGSAGVRVALSRMPLVCAELGGGRSGPCPGAGAALAELGAVLAQALREDPRWQRRLRDRERVCRELPRIVGTLPRAPPQLRIVPERSGAALTLACHAWGFSPPDITLRWLRNGAVVEEPRGPPRALPLGDGTFRAQVNVEVTPGTAGDTFECWALHASLEDAISVTWAPGLSPKLSLLVALAVLALLLGLLLFIFGLSRYLGTGYTPLPGDTHTGNI